MSTIASLMVKLGIDASQYQSGLTSAEKATTNFARSQGQATTSMNGMVGGLAAVAAGVMAYKVAVEGAVVTSLKLYGWQQQISIAFETMLGSAEAAKGMMEDLFAFAKVTPFQIKDVVDASRLLKAYGFEAENIIPILKRVGDTAAGLGLGGEGVNRIVIALGQMKAKGAFSGEEMRQLGQAGIEVWKILAKVIGTDTTTAMKMAEDRAISTGKYLNQFIEEIGLRFPNLMDKQSKSLLGLWSNLQDSATLTFMAIGEAIAKGLNLEDKLASLISVTEVFAGMLKKFGIAGAFEQMFSPQVRALILGVAGVIGGALVAAMVVATISLVGMAAAMLGVTWPVVLIGAAIGLLAVAWQQNWGDIQGWTQKAVDIHVKLFQDLMGAVDWMGQTWGNFANFMGGIWTTITAAASQALGWIGDRIGDFLSMMAQVPGVGEAFKWAGDRIGDFGRVAAPVFDAVGAAWKGAGDMAGNLGKTVGDLGGTIGSFVGETINGLTLPSLDDLKGLVADLARKLDYDLKPGLDNANTGLDDTAQKASKAAAAIADMINALIAANPAVIAAGEAIAGWKQRIEDVNLAIIANRDQIKAAEADYQGMQDHLAALKDELSGLKDKLNDLASPRLTGMGEMDDKIAAAAKQLQRLQYAASTGLPMDQVMQMFPVLTEGMEAFIGSLPAAIRDNADALQKFLEGLKATKDLKYSEQLDLIKKAAEGTKKEMDFSEVMKSIIETKAKIVDVTGAIQTQELAMKAQKAVIDELKKISDDLNATLATYQKELKLAEDYQRDLEKALKDAYDWFLNDKDAVEKMGGSAVTIAGNISDAYAAILAVVDASVTTATGNVSAAIAGIQKQIEDLKAALAGLGVPSDLGLKSIGTMGIHPVPGTVNRSATLAANLRWFTPGLMGGAFDADIKAAMERYAADMDKFFKSGDLAKQAEAEARLIAAMDAVRAEYYRTQAEMEWYNNELRKRTAATATGPLPWALTATTGEMGDVARADIKAEAIRQIKLLQGKLAELVGRYRSFTDMPAEMQAAYRTWQKLLQQYINSVGGSWFVPSFALGGIVPGPVGAPVLARVHGGETITPAGGAGNVYNLNFGRDSVRSEDDLRAISREVSRIMGGGITLRN